MVSKSFKKILLLSFVFVTVFPFVSNAQFGGLILNEFLTVNLSPENPGPFERVTASLELYLTDLKKAQISWYLNGELIESGIGNTIFSFETGPVGSVTKVSLVLLTFEGQEFQREIEIRSAEVDLVWNADSYTPPFYKGRALYPLGGSVSVSAIPNIFNSSGTKINPASLVYEWYQNSTLLNSQSGLGKNKITISEGVVSRPSNIKVIVSNLDGTIKAENTLQLSSQPPQVLVYEKNPLYGILLNRAITDIDMKDREMILVAIPYFFSTVLKDSFNLEYTWRQNGKALGPLGSQNSVTVRQENENQSGEVNIEIGVRNHSNFLQTASAKTNINLNPEE